MTVVLLALLVWTCAEILDALGEIRDAVIDNEEEGDEEYVCDES